MVRRSDGHLVAMVGKRGCHGHDSLARGIQNGNDPFGLYRLHSERRHTCKRLISLQIGIHLGLDTPRPLHCLIMSTIVHYLRPHIALELQAFPTHFPRRPCLRSLQHQPLHSPREVPQHPYPTGGTAHLVGRNRLWSPALRLQSRLLSVGLHLPASKILHKGLLVKSLYPFLTLSNHSVPIPALLRSSLPRQLTQRTLSDILHSLPFRSRKDGRHLLSTALISRGHLAFNRQAL